MKPMHLVVVIYFVGIIVGAVFFNLWGTGKSKREIIYVDDLADAIVFFMNKIKK